MSYNYKKVSLIVLVSLIFFSFFWYMQNNIYLSHMNNQTLLNMNSSSQGFSSLRMFSLYYTMYFLLIVNIQVRNEEALFVVRQKNREKLFNKRTLQIFFTAGLFSLSFSVVNLLMTYIFVGNIHMIHDNFYRATLFNGMAVLLFYWSIGLLEKLIEDKFNSRNVAVLITFLLVASGFFIKSIPWVPIKDMVVYENLLTNTWNTLDLLKVYGRQFGLVIVLFLLGSIVFKEKDFLHHEK